MRMLRPLRLHWAYESGTDACTEHTHKELMLTVSIRVRNWCVRWAYGSGTVACTEHTSQELSTHMKFEKVPSKHAEHMQQEFTPWAYASGNDAYTEHTLKELMHALSMRVRNWCLSSACASEIKWCLAPPKIKIVSLGFSPKVTYPERLFGVKIMKIRAIKNLTLGHL